MRCLSRATLALVAASLLAAACGTPAPAPRLYQLRMEAPVAAASASATRGQGVWELASDVRVPAYLDRDTLVMLEGTARLELLQGQRWAEPLRDTLPRLLGHDLGLLRGASNVWLAPAPPGVQVSRQLRVEILSLQASRARGAVLLQARWWFTGDRSAPPQALTADLQVPVSNLNDGDAIAAAHRVALWQLAERIARQP
ncbi:MAG TPA: ABC-type transport auxiliary lipoprotein family protein [Rubrivivax sp.]|nr:ABC-type transport auxiliary lipoprotein family protein [Rubrivivax sp.]